MIDTNELRRLAQAATPGPWKAGQYLGSLRQFVIHTDVGDKGRGSDVAFTSAAFGNDETVANARLIAAANPATISELLDRLEAAEKERDALRDRIEVTDEVVRELEKKLSTGMWRVLREENETLRAKVNEMEKQKPAYWGPKHAIEGGSTTVIVGKFPVNPTDAPLYALPGAQGEEA